MADLWDSLLVKFSCKHPCMTCTTPALFSQHPHSLPSHTTLPHSPSHTVPPTQPPPSPAQLPKTLSHRQPSLLPAVEVAGGGASYNPCFGDHQDLLRVAVAEAEAKEKEEGRVERWYTGMPRLGHLQREVTPATCTADYILVWAFSLVVNCDGVSLWSYCQLTESFGMSYDVTNH